MTTEVLLMMPEGDQRDSLEQRLEEGGYMVTDEADPERATAWAREKHFPAIVAVVDPGSEAGTALLKRFVEESPASALVVACKDASFSAAVASYRAGASDAVALDRVEELEAVLARVSTANSRRARRDKLLLEVKDLHDRFLKLLIATHRKAKQSKEQASGLHYHVNRTVLLIVDNNPSTCPGLQEALGGEKDYECLCALNGGEALDYATNRAFDIALVNESLPDLSGKMVATTLRSQAGQAIVLIFRHPVAEQPGYVSIVEPERTIELVSQLTGAAQLVERLKGLRQAQSNRATEKHYMQLFREEHHDFLKRYVELRTEIDRLVSEEADQ